MKKLSLLLLLVTIIWTGRLTAQEKVEEKSETVNKFNLLTYDLPYNVRSNREFQFLAYFITQGVTTNTYPKASLFNGQLVGRLFG